MQLTYVRSPIMMNVNNGRIDCCFLLKKRSGEEALREEWYRFPIRSYWKLLLL